MRQSLAVFLVLVLGGAATALGAGKAAEPTLSFSDFSDWFFANSSGLRALEQGNLQAASHRFRNAIEIALPVASNDPRPLARTYSDFALVLLQQGRANEAEPLALWALKVREKWFGKDSRQAATTLHVLALLASAQMQYARSEDLLSRALLIREKTLGPDDPQTAVVLNDLATLCSLRHKYDKAESLFRRVVAIPSDYLATTHPDRAIALIGLSSVYSAQGETSKAEATEQQLIDLVAHMPLPGYVSISPSLRQYLTQLRRLGRNPAAERLEESIRTRPPPETAERLPPRGPHRARPSMGPRAT
jgi:tetratricopeptide (TPR) repeat protein